MSSYDDIPYPAIARRQTHPSHLAALATLFGMQPAPVTRCRVLDVGCADGSNLIAMAHHLPASQFVGLDLSPRQIAAGQAKAAALGLSNLTLQAMNLLDIHDNLGEFDYIIFYGVYSWAPPDAQAKVLQICQQHLAPQGVAYISYNVYPGWHMHGLARGLMRYQTRHLTEPAARVSQARAILDFMTEVAPTLSSNLTDALQANHLILQSLRDLLRDQPDEYLLHDQLESINQPLHLYEFMERAEQSGLQYLADAESSALMSAYLPPQLAHALAQMAHSRVEMEQLLDFLYARAFRQTLLCRREITLSEVKPENLTGLHIAAQLEPAGEVINLHAPEAESFRGPHGVTLNTSQPLNKAALLHLAEIWPQTIAFDRLLAAARARLSPAAPPVYSAARQAQEVDTLGEVLLKGHALNMVEFHGYSPAFTLTPGDYPTASALARLEARQGRLVTNQRHEVVNLEGDDDLGYHLLPDLDGQHSRAALEAKLRDMAAQGALRVESDGAAESELLSEALAYSLHRLAHLALLVA